MSIGGQGGKHGIGSHFGLLISALEALLVALAGYGPKRSRPVTDDDQAATDASRDTKKRLGSRAASHTLSSETGEDGTGVCEAAALHPRRKKRPEFPAQNGPNAYTKHTRTPSVDGPSAGQYSFEGPSDPQRFGGVSAGKSRSQGSLRADAWPWIFCLWCEFQR